MIISRAFIEAYKADKLRQEILKRAHVREIIDFRDLPVFPGIGIATALLFLDIKPPSKDGFTQVSSSSGLAQSKTRKNRAKTRGPIDQQPKNPFSDIHAGFAERATLAYHCKIKAGVPDLGKMTSTSFDRYERDIRSLGGAPWVFGSGNTLALHHKLDEHGVSLGSLTHIGKGMETGANNIFGNKSLADIKSLNVSSNCYRKRASNSDISRYMLRDRSEYLLYLEDIVDYSKLSVELAAYLSSEMSKLKGRAAFKRGNCDWWRYTWPLHRQFYDRSKILCPYLAKGNRFAIDRTREFIGLTDTTVIFDCFEKLNVLYVLGLLNSKLLDFRFKGIGKLKGGGIYEYFWNTVQRLPIRPIDFDNPDDVALHDKMVMLVERMLELNEKKAREKNPQLLRQIETQLETTDRRIDRIVYRLYDLTEEEIALVEGGKE